MNPEFVHALICPVCRGPLGVAKRRCCRDAIQSGILHCRGCRREYPVVAGIPSMLPRRHPHPIQFLPPEGLLPQPPGYLTSRKRKNGLERYVEHYGRTRFLNTLRRRPLGDAYRTSHLRDAYSRRRGGRCSRPDYFLHVVNELMRKHWWKEDRFRALLAAVESLQPRRLLDIASGPGSFLCRILSRQAQLEAVGLEIYLDKSRMVTAEARHLAFSPRLQMVHGDARLMPFPDDVFDCISGLTAAYHMARYECAIRESHRVLRPGGHFVGTFHITYPSHCEKLLTRVEEETFIRWAHLPFNLDEVRNVFCESGFFIEHVEAIGGTALLVARKK